MRMDTFWRRFWDRACVEPDDGCKHCPYQKECEKQNDTCGNFLKKMFERYLIEGK